VSPILEYLGKNITYSNFIQWLKDQFSAEVSSCRAAKESGDWEKKITEYTAAYENNLVDSKRMNFEVVS